MPCFHAVVRRDPLALDPTVVLRQERAFDKLVQPVQIDIGENGTRDSTLRRAAERLVELPVLEISSSEQFTDQPQEAAVVDLLSQNRQQDLMVKSVETLADISFYEPGCASPRVVNFQQSSMTSVFWTKTMGMVRELRLVIGIQDRPNDLLEQLIGPCWKSERALFHRAFLLNVHAPHRRPSKALMTQRVNGCLDFRLGHSVRSFVCCTGCHSTPIAGNVAVRT